MLCSDSALQPCQKSRKQSLGKHNFTMQTIAKIETALGCKLINIAKWDLQTKGKENLSSPCFFVCADYPNTPSVRLTVWIFLSRLTLTSSSSSLQGIDWASSSLLLLRAISAALGRAFKQVWCSALVGTRFQFDFCLFFVRFLICIIRV